MTVFVPGLTVSSRPLPSELPNIYTTLGQDYDDRVG